MDIQKSAPSSSFSRSALLALAAIVPVFATSVLGSIATMPQIPAWYTTIDKPSFNPPNWVFGPAWTILFIMMAYAFWRVLKLAPSTLGRRAAITIFLVQLVFNAGWSWAFFWGQSPLAGLVVIAFLLLSIMSTIAAFWRLDRIAGLLLTPYLAWVTFASALNAAIFVLNR
jgi:benzodiazapine receptor